MWVSYVFFMTNISDFTVDISVRVTSPFYINLASTQRPVMFRGPWENVTLQLTQRSDIADKPTQNA